MIDAKTRPSAFALDFAPLAFEKWKFYNLIAFDYCIFYCNIAFEKWKYVFKKKN